MHFILTYIFFQNVCPKLHTDIETELITMLKQELVNSRAECFPKAKVIVDFNDT